MNRAEHCCCGLDTRAVLGEVKALVVLVDTARAIASVYAETFMVILLDMKG